MIGDTASGKVMRVQDSASREMLTADSMSYEISAVLSIRQDVSAVRATDPHRAKVFRCLSIRDESVVRESRPRVYCK